MARPIEIFDGLSLGYVAKSTAYTATASDYWIDCSSTMTLTLPTPVGCAGRTYFIKNAGTGVVTIATAAGAIDGAATFILNVQNQGMGVISDGTNWLVGPSYKLPPIPHAQLSNAIAQVIPSGQSAKAYPVLFDTNDELSGIAHDIAGVAVLISNGTPCVCTYTATAAFPTLVNGDCVKFTTLGALPASLAVGTAYYVVNAGTDGAGKFRLAASPGGADINTTDAGSSTHTVKCNHRIYIPATGDYLAILSILVNSSDHDTIYVWARLAGSDIARSTTQVGIAKEDLPALISVPLVLMVTSQNTKFEWYWGASSDASSLPVFATGSNPTRPATPSAILTITKVAK